MHANAIDRNELERKRTRNRLAQQKYSKLVPHHVDFITSLTKSLAWPQGKKLQSHIKELEKRAAAADHLWKAQGRPNISSGQASSVISEDQNDDTQRVSASHYQPDNVLRHSQPLGNTEVLEAPLEPSQAGADALSFGNFSALGQCLVPALGSANGSRNSADFFSGTYFRPMV